MLRIGYVRLGDGTAAAEATASLKALGCHVVRAEEPGSDGAVLVSILDFLAEGDHLVVSQLGHLSSTPRRLLSVLERLEARGAVLEVMEPELSTRGSGAAALRAALQAVGGLEAGATRKRPEAAMHEIRALQRAGLGPVEIARRLGVSRMTVWRKLKALSPGSASAARLDGERA